MPFYPVKLGSTDLKQHLFNTRNSFTDIKQGRTNLEVSQPSVICTKELKDREVVGQAILQMMPSDNLVIYSNGPRIIMCLWFKKICNW